MKLDEIPTTAMTLILIGVIFVAGFLVMNGLLDSQYVAGCNATNQTGCDGEELAVITGAGNITEGLTNVVEYAPTWGVIIGVAVLLGIVVLGFYFARTKGYL